MEEKETLFQSFEKMAKTNAKNLNIDYLNWGLVDSLKTYSFEETNKILKEGTLLQKIELSRNFFYKDGLYRRILIHYITFLLNYGLLIPNPSFGKKLSTGNIQKRYNKALKFVDNLNIQEMLINFSTHVFVEGCYYGLVLESNNDEVMILDLPTSYCASRAKDLFGRDIIEFDVNYFNSFTDEETKKRVLSCYPKEVISFYRKNKSGYITLPAEKTIYFCLYDCAYPIFLDIIPATLQYDDAVLFEREKDREEIKKIIINQIPHLADGQLLFEPPEAEEMHTGVVNMMKGNKNVSVLTTYGNVDSIVSKTTSDNNSNTVDKTYQNIYATAGTTSQVFAPTGVQALKDSLANDLAFVMGLAVKYQTFITRLVNWEFGNKFLSFKYTILPISYYNQDAYLDNAFKLAQNGYSLILPSVVMGIGQNELSNLKDLENDVLNLNEKLIPPKSSYTQTNDDEGGRPTKEPDEKKESTITKEESINNQGEA